MDNNDKNTIEAKFSDLLDGEKFLFENNIWIKKNFLAAVTEDGDKLYNFDHRSTVKKIIQEDKEQFRG